SRLWTSHKRCTLSKAFDLHSTDAVWKPKKPFSSVVCVTVIYIPLMLFGLLGNILTILVVWLRPHMRSSTYLYLSSMAVSDLLILLLLPLDLYKLWRPRPWLLGDLTCKLTMFLSECCTFCTILHITFLSLERYVAVCWPITAKTTVTRRRTRALIGCLWLGAAISAAPVLVMVGVEENGIKELCRCTDYAVSSGLLAAMMILSNLYFLVPVFILGLVYSLIGRTLSTKRVIVLAFVLCWLPFHVGRTIFSLDTQLYFLYYLSQYFNLVSSVLYYLSAAVNPLLYNMMSTRYRHAVHSLVHANCNTQPRRAHTTVTAQNSTTPCWWRQLHTYWNATSSR
uniref:G-protein coupled receptors family 1 profile domain-containing protein n=1 Tax=Cynoglossus semilaevis TaxID=244447 RepID=A0A3P8WKG3_CYNSE